MSEKTNGMHPTHEAEVARRIKQDTWLRKPKHLTHKQWHQARSKAS